MSAVTFADNAAAVAAGWSRTQWQFAGAFFSMYSKRLTGDLGSGKTAEHLGTSTVSQAAADTAALANINAMRLNRYGPDTTTPNKGNRKATALTIDAE